MTIKKDDTKVNDDIHHSTTDLVSSYLASYI